MVGPQHYLEAIWTLRSCFCSRKTHFSPTVSVRVVTHFKHDLRQSDRLTSQVEVVMFALNDLKPNDR